MPNPVLNSIATVTATREPDVYIVRCNITDIEGLDYDVDYCSRPEDIFGVNPSIRQYLADNPDFPIEPFVPPTPEEARANAAPLSARQLRLQIVADGFSTAVVDQAIAEMPDGPEKETATINWQFGAIHFRLDALITPIIRDALGYSEEQMDAFWDKALGL